MLAQPHYGGLVPQQPKVDAGSLSNQPSCLPSQAKEEKKRRVAASSTSGQTLRTEHPQPRISNHSYKEKTRTRND
jgi:hypothetical protein